MRRPFSTSGLRSLLLLGIAGVLAGCGETESDFQKKVASAKDRRASLLLEVELHESIIRDAKSRLSDVASLRTAQDDAAAEHKRVKEALDAARQQLAEEDKVSQRLEIQIEQAAERARAQLVGTSLKDFRLKDGKSLGNVRVTSATDSEVVVRTELGARRLNSASLPDDFLTRYRMKVPGGALVGTEADTPPPPPAIELAKITSSSSAAREREEVTAKINWLEARIAEAENSKSQWIERADASRERHYAARKRGNISGHLVTAQRAEAEAERIGVLIDDANRRLWQLRAQRGN